MKTLYINDIRNALKSKEYWFGFALILVSGILTAVFNLSPTGIFGDYNIGNAEFFISAVMYGNTLFKMSAPVIAIFVCINRQSIFMSDKQAIDKSWKNKEMKARILANVTIGGNVFIFS